MTNRSRGDYFERQTVAALAARGWVARRSGGSLGAADIWALRSGNTPLLIACKLHGRIDPAERMALIHLAQKAGARPILALRPKAGTVELRRVLPSSGQPHVALLKVPKRVPRQPEDPDPDEPSPAPRSE